MKRAGVLVFVGVLWTSAVLAAEKGGAGSYRRLPAHYKDVVTQTQREAIYRIQEEFGPKLAELKAKIAELEGQRRAKIEGLLTPEQKAKLERARAKRAPRGGKCQDVRLPDLSAEANGLGAAAFLDLDLVFTGQPADGLEHEILVAAGGLDEVRDAQGALGLENTPNNACLVADRLDRRRV